MVNPNDFAYLALILWLPVSFVGLSLARPSIAVASLMIGAVMFLPARVEFDLPGMPPIGKEEMASLGLLLACLARYPGVLREARPGRGPEILVLVLVVAGFGTALTNGDALAFGPTRLPALEPYDAVSTGIRDIIRYGLPFFLGRAFYRKTLDLRDFLVVLASAGLVYSLFILFELRMSPNLHRWIYGFGQHGFSQHIRWGGYRPMVFMAGGLAVALFVVNALTSAAALVRQRTPVLGLPPGPIVAYLAVILVLCKSFASYGYALLTVPVVLLARARLQALLALALAVLVFVYPLMRASAVFPTEGLVSVASRISEERADSLGFRFDNEDLLLERASQRPWFGWGGFRRSRVFHAIFGTDLSITDGFWIITLGHRGFAGYLLIFGLLLWPIVLAARRRALTRGEREARVISSVALMLVINCVDLLPNGMFTNFIVFQAGAIAGACSRPAARSGGTARRSGRRRRRRTPRAGAALDEEAAPTRRAGTGATPKASRA